MAKELFRQSLLNTVDSDMRIPLAKFADLTPSNLRFSKLIEIIADEFGLPPDQFISSGVTGSFPAVVSQVGNVITLDACDVLIRSSADSSQPLTKVTVPSAALTITSGVLSYITAYNNGSTTSYSVVTSVAGINEENRIPIYTAFNEDGTIHLLDWDSLADGLPNKLHQRFVKTQRFSRESGFALSEYGTRNLALTDGSVWNGAVRHEICAKTSIDDGLQFYYHSGGDWTKTTATQYNNTQYDNGTDLVTASNNKYIVNWIYITVDVNHCEFIQVTGNDEYLTIAAASESQQPELPPLVQGLGFLVGRVIVEKGASTGIVEGAFDAEFGFTPINDHNNLSGLDGGAANEYFHLTLNDYNNRITRKRINPSIVAGTPDTLTIDFDGNNEVFANKSGGGGIAVGGNFTLAASNFTNAEGAQIYLELSTAATIALSANIITSDNLTLNAGKYQLVMTYDGAEFHVVISEPEN